MIGTALNKPTKFQAKHHGVLSTNVPDAEHLPHYIVTGSSATAIRASPQSATSCKKATVVFMVRARLVPLHLRADMANKATVTASIANRPAPIVFITLWNAAKDDGNGRIHVVLRAYFVGLPQGHLCTWAWMMRRRDDACSVAPEKVTYTAE